MQNRIITSTLHGRRRSEWCPQWLGTGFTAGRHVEADSYKLVALQDHRHDLVSVCVGQHWRSRVVVRLPGLSLAGIQNLGTQRSGQVRSDNTMGLSLINLPGIS